MKYISRTIITLVLLNLILSHASIDIYEFDDPVAEKRFKSLTRELRCPKCQNQNIADSNAPQAQDLREYTYQMINEGRADSEIISFMVARYGDFVTYKPPMKPITWALWFAPVVLLVGIVGFVIIRRRPKAQQYTEKALTPEEISKLDKILNKE